MQSYNTEKADYGISVVIVSYNTREMVRECLESVFLNSGDLDLQVIIVDNNSIDGTVEMLKSQFPQVVLIENKRNLGFAAANNQALSLANKGYVLLLNSDTIVLRDAMQKSVKKLQQRIDVAAMGCRVLNTDRTIQRTCSGYPTLKRLFYMTIGLDRLPFFDTYLLRYWPRDSEREVDVISGCYFLTTRKTLNEIGGLDEDFFFFGEETDWCLRARKRGYKLLFSPVGDIIHHGGGSVKKLNYKRDVMLSNATIRLHKKHSGEIAAFLAYIALIIFNFSRMLAWSYLCLFRRKEKRTGCIKANHFRRVVTHFHEAWPL
ncbi:putative glycosyltransferase [Thioflavicoccus mobilis 8321]|uniref:Putative glycosyltransferase n=1 Tax=Thioflavicoccus mobilis 8321 TaxID=765912 RepID=L0H278_9GAMM|nr:glycosyltransferase family 2 protein [Thioflavicoccus mobilis]AGA91755.1 putative glycosyltransferase [Thioflavicoccus mobilis 8321]